MTQRLLRTRFAAALVAAAAGLFLLTPRLPADPTPGKQDRNIAQLVCTFLQRVHLARPEIGDEISKRLFRHFLKDLDPAKLYFVQSDIDEFKKQETKLDDQILEGDLSFAYDVYKRYLQRYGERLKLIEELLQAPQDFTAKEYLSTDYDKTDYTKNDQELRERWRKRLKYDLLLQRIGQKPAPDDEARKKVLERYQSLLKYYKQLDNYDLLAIYLTGLTTSIDPHSTYMSPNQLADFDIAMRLHLEGIGALLRSENGQTIIAEIIPGGAAAQDGRLKVNDKIIAVAQDDAKFLDVIDMKLTEVVKLIRGKAGTQVYLKVIPAGKVEPVVYSMTRQKIELKSQEARGDVVQDGKKADGTPYRIGVIDLPSFYADMASSRNGQEQFKSATEDVRRILNDFKAKNVDGVILDLRHNGGGALTEALALTGLFIDQGPVVQVKGGQGGVRQQNDPEKGVVYDGPLMVLVSKLSASASEILAGALQDYGRALVAGDSTTHGKGTVQVVIDLGNQLQIEPAPKLGALKLTIQQFYRVNGDSTQNRGVASDITLPSLIEELATGEKELDHALAFDKVKPAPHEQLDMVPSALKEKLKAQSAERVKNSGDFAKLQKQIEQVKARKASKQVPLNEQELRDQRTKDDKTDKVDGVDLKDEDPTAPETPTTDKGEYKFKRNYMNNEILQIMEDYMRERKS
jgi:carboxyl-terminal processing protease